VLHKLTTRLANCYGMVGIEDLNLKGLLKNRKLARSFSDRIFLCQNPICAYYQLVQDRDHNAALCILFEALRLIGLSDQAVTDIGSGDDVNLTADEG